MMSLMCSANASTTPSSCDEFWFEELTRIRRCSEYHKREQLDRSELLRGNFGVREWPCLLCLGEHPKPASCERLKTGQL